MDAITVRRATHADYEAVLAINDNIYDGRDYMPTLFHHFIQCKQFVVYVAEMHKAVVSIVLRTRAYFRSR